MPQFNIDGPVVGPTGEWELDPDNNQCGDGKRPVFATCKNNCPGGELSVVRSELFSNRQTADKLNVSRQLRKYNSLHYNKLLYYSIFSQFPGCWR